MQGTSSEIAELIVVLSNELSKNSIRTVISKLSYSTDASISVSDVQECIIDLICQEFSVTINELKGKTKRPAPSKARKYCIFLLQSYTGKTHNEIGFILGRTGAYVHEVIQQFSELNVNIKSDLEIQQTIKKIDAKVLEYVKTKTQVADKTDTPKVEFNPLALQPKFDKNNKTKK
jgi:chromosomal replication initiation ATPase DnaA